MDEQKKTSGSLALNGGPRVITIPPSDPVRARKLRVAAYARVSSGSEDQLNSFAAQNAHYTELITANPEWEFVDVYADKGITGTSAERREDFQRLLADCRRGRVDKILVKSSSRFARNTKECLEAVRELKALGVGVCFEEQGIDTSELAGEFLTAIFAMMDQNESKSISDNIRWSYHARMRSGRFIPATMPYGYQKAGKAYTVVPDEAKIVQQIFTLYLTGKSISEIASKLNSKSTHTHSSYHKTWTPQAILRILRNEKYAGNSLWQKTYQTATFPSIQKVNTGEMPQYYMEKTHTSIVPQKIYQLVQPLIKKREKYYVPKEGTVSLLNKNILCQQCGSLFRKKNVRGKTYWVCRNHEQNKMDCMVYPILEAEIYLSFLSLYHKLRHQGISILTQLLTDLQSARKGKLLWSLDIVALNQKIADITRQDRLLAQLKQQGLVDPDIFISRQNELAEQLRAVKLEKERSLEAEEDQTIQQTQELIEALEAGPDFLETFDGELFRELVDKIIVESNDRLRFRLVNGLELTEPIERTVR